jgi:hypothetical protein
VARRRRLGSRRRARGPWRHLYPFLVHRG